MLEKIGQISNPTKEVAALQIVDILNGKYKDIIGEAYFGYPVYIDQTMSKQTSVDLAIISSMGAFFINFLSEAITDYKIIQDEIFLRLESRFKKYPFLVNNRSLVFEVNTITYSFEKIEAVKDESVVYSLDELMAEIDKLKTNLNSGLVIKISSAIQEAYGINTREERGNLKPGTKAYAISTMDRIIEKYDVKQMDAILSDPRGIQRIRGMAGSGKTIVLARKAVELHTSHPEWTIVVTYNTRSLKKQLENMISKFFAQKNEGASFDSNKLRIMHAWGSTNSPGVYYEACISNGISPLNFTEAKNKYGPKYTFSKMCAGLLAQGIENTPIYDCILIDEAQDFDGNFLNICLKLLDSNTRLVYAYDELQDLGETSLPDPIELFGKTIKQDTPLTVCYRNQKETIVSAHAIGLGIYRPDGLVQLPSSSDVWTAIGYEANKPIIPGQQVTLFRTRETSPNLLGIKDSDIVTMHNCLDKADMFNKLFMDVRNDLYIDELLPKDIMVIDMDALSYADNVQKLRQLVSLEMDEEDVAMKRRIRFHQSGALSPEDFFRKDSIVYSSVFRAKGNEAYMVYIVNAQNCINSLSSTRDRNSLFTAITRSKGWVRVLGFGPNMQALIDEFEIIKQNGFELNFKKYPTAEEQKELVLNNKDIEGRDQTTLDNARVLVSRLMKDKKHTNEQILQAVFGVASLEELAMMLEEKK